MAIDSGYIVLHCINDKCGAMIKIKPPQPGKAFTFECPKCKCRQKWSYEGIDSDCKPVVVPLGLVKPEQVPPGPVPPGPEPPEPDPPTPIPPITRDNVMPMPGRLVRVKSGIFARNEIINLRPGENVIGQRDRQKPSTIEIDDKFMSRRSVQLFVEAVEGGYEFKFTLLKSLNPAFVNGKEVQPGFSKPLKFGDTFRIGTTDFIFEGIDGSRKPMKQG